MKINLAITKKMTYICGYDERIIMSNKNFKRDFAKLVNNYGEELDCHFDDIVDVLRIKRSKMINKEHLMRFRMQRFFDII